MHPPELDLAQFCRDRTLQGSAHGDAAGGQECKDLLETSEVAKVVTLMPTRPRGMSIAPSSRGPSASIVREKDHI